jgi:hypothetical protein
VLLFFRTATIRCAVSPNRAQPRRRGTLHVEDASGGVEAPELFKKGFETVIILNERGAWCKGPSETGAKHEDLRCGRVAHSHLTAIFS